MSFMGTALSKQRSCCDWLIYRPCPINCLHSRTLCNVMPFCSPPPHLLPSPPSEVMASLIIVWISLAVLGPQKDLPHHFLTYIIVAALMGHCTSSGLVDVCIPYCGCKSSVFPVVAQVEVVIAADFMVL